MNLRIKEPYSWVGHIPFAFYLVEQLKPNVIVELGTHTGNSFTAFCQASKDYSPNTKVYAIDTWKGDEHAGYYDEKIFEDLNAYISEHFSRIGNMIRKDFNDAVYDFDDNSIDVLHIDGLHTYEAVKNDFETWLPKMKNNGIILFHDIDAKLDGFEVFRFWNELKCLYKIHYSFSHSFGLGVLYIGNKRDTKEFNLIKHLNKGDFQVQLLKDHGKYIFDFFIMNSQNRKLELKIEKIMNSKKYKFSELLVKILKFLKVK